MPKKLRTANPVLKVPALHRRHSPHRALSAAEIPTICAQHDAQFRQLTECGNKAFAAGDQGAARSFSDEALGEAKAVFSRACTNLASARSLIHDEGGARASLVQAVESLTEAAATVTFPLAMRMNRLRHLRHALGFPPDLAEPPTQADLTSKALTERAVAAATEVIRTARISVSSMNVERGQPC
ncbi:hypothetical protein [Methylobacterium sp. ID0610]|uniref:hypothetical protein n=1 Tax=Methylobacterium carpenticola TaxID=3344827 RepID=UPI0036A33263